MSRTGPPTDPMERIVYDALVAAGYEFVTDYGGQNPSNLDFRLGNGIEIEVKRFHTPRIAGQMARADNVIAVQGKDAMLFFAELLKHTTPHGAAAKRQPPAVTAWAIDALLGCALLGVLGYCLWGWAHFMGFL